MEITVKLDLGRYSDEEIATFFAQGVISRDELERWRAEKQGYQRPESVEL